MECTSRLYRENHYKYDIHDMRSYQVTKMENTAIKIAIPLTACEVVLAHCSMEVIEVLDSLQLILVALTLTLTFLQTVQKICQTKHVHS